MRLAIIPARGGSKRIPRKNIKKFAGKPVIAYSIECALQSDIFDHVIVSTDDKEIYLVACEYGAEVPFMRPKELADDHSSMNDVIVHAIKWFQEQSVTLSAVCLIFPAAPFLTREDLRAGFALLESGDWNYVLSATTYASSVFRSFKKNTQDGLEMLFPEYFNTRSQDLAEVWHDAAQFCFGRPQAWLENIRTIDPHSTALPIPNWRVQDIDTIEDWKRAEVLWKVLQSIEKDG